MRWIQKCSIWRAMLKMIHFFVFSKSEALCFHFSWSIINTTLRSYSCITLSAFTPTRWGHNIVQSNHTSQHSDGAVHEGHSYTLCPPRSQRHHPQDHGKQTVLRGSFLQRCSPCYVQQRLTLPPPFLFSFICATRLIKSHSYHSRKAYLNRWVSLSFKGYY